MPSLWYHTEVKCLLLGSRKDELFLLATLELVSFGYQPHFEDVDCLDLVALLVFAVILLSQTILLPLMTASFYSRSALQVTSTKHMTLKKSQFDEYTSYVPNSEVLEES